jgi:hypothetical protein
METRVQIIMIVASVNEARVQIIAILASVLLLVVVLELVRRRRLLERYAVLWLLSAAVLVVLSAWRNLLALIAHRLGIAYAPNALFLIAFGFVAVLLLHFSLSVSRLADQSKVLAQRLALVQERLARLQGDETGQPAEVPSPDEPEGTELPAHLNGEEDQLLRLRGPRETEVTSR